MKTKHALSADQFFPNAPTRGEPAAALGDEAIRPRHSDCVSTWLFKAIRALPGRLAAVAARANAAGRAL